MTGDSTAHAQILEGIAQVLQGIAATLRATSEDPIAAMMRAHGIGPSLDPDPLGTPPADPLGKSTFGSTHADSFSGMSSSAPPDDVDPMDVAAMPSGGPVAAEPALRDREPSTFQKAPCEELTRQAADSERIKDLLADPENWMATAAYYCQLLNSVDAHITPNAERAEELVRCVEALPGNVDPRLVVLMEAPAARIAGYAKEWGRADTAITQALEDAVIGADHRGRLLFCLGDQPTEDDIADAESDAA